MEESYSVRACKQNLYVTGWDGVSVTLGNAQNRIIFYNSNEAEQCRELCDEIMDDCFQVVTE